jgi:serine/threonine protein phosphatase 1
MMQTGKTGFWQRLRTRFVAESGAGCLPDGTRVYAVGDIHGRLDLLERMLEKIAGHAAETPYPRNVLVFLGDYVDRGPASKAVVERLAHLHISDWQIVCLRGNHDQAVLDFLNSPQSYRAWRDYGAAETLYSYGVSPPLFDRMEDIAAAHAAFGAVLPPAHRKFFSNLEYFHVEGGYMFVHAGVRPGIALDRQLPEDLMWIREDFLEADQRLKKVIVHGHSPTSAPQRLSHRIAVDTGAYATGCLSAVALYGQKNTFLSVNALKIAV